MKTIKNIVLLIASISLMFLTACQQQELSDAKYFKITESELVDKLNANHEDDFELKDTANSENGTQKTLTYVYNDENEMEVNYIINFDKPTGRVSRLDFWVDDGYPDSMEIYRKYLTYLIQTLSPSTSSGYIEDIVVEDIIENIYTDTFILNDTQYDAFILTANYNPEYNYLAASIRPNDETHLSTGLYVVGEDIPEGKYDVYWNGGEGVFSVTGAHQIHETFGWDEPEQIQDFKNLTLSKRDEVKISGNLEVRLVLQ